MVLVHHSVKDGLLGGKAALLSKPDLGHSVMLSLPGRGAFRVGGVCLLECGEQPSGNRLDLVAGCFDPD
jgi:hypothetical protein